MVRRPWGALLVASLCLALVAAPAQAYIDPGAGSLALQALIGALAALTFGLRSRWSRITGWWRRRHEPAAPDHPGSAPGR